MMTRLRHLVILAAFTEAMPAAAQPANAFAAGDTPASAKP